MGVVFVLAFILGDEIEEEFFQFSRLGFRDIDLALIGNHVHDLVASREPEILFFGGQAIASGGDQGVPCWIIFLRFCDETDAGAKAECGAEILCFVESFFQEILVEARPLAVATSV